jgi:hypothetical protein
MKKEVSPTVVAVVIGLIVVILGVFLYRQANYNPPTPHPNPKFIGGAGAASATTQGKQ